MEHKLNKYLLKKLNYFNNDIYNKKINFYLQKYIQHGGVLEDIITNVNTICDNNITGIPYIHINTCDEISARLGTIGFIYIDNSKYDSLITDEIVVVCQTTINNRSFIIKCEQLAHLKPTREAVLMLLMKNLFERDGIIKLHFLELRNYFVSRGKCIGDIKLDEGIYEYKIMDKCDGTLGDYIGELRSYIIGNTTIYIRKMFIIFFQILYIYRRILEHIPFFIHGDLSISNILYVKKTGIISYPLNGNIININLEEIDNNNIVFIDYGMYASNDILNKCRPSEIDKIISIKRDIGTIFNSLFLNTNLLYLIIKNRADYKSIFEIMYLISYKDRRDIDKIIEKFEKIFEFNKESSMINDLKEKLLMELPEGIQIEQNNDTDKILLDRLILLIAPLI
jgi:serine/threonine protein kinase